VVKNKIDGFKAKMKGNSFIEEDDSDSKEEDDSSEKTTTLS